jgi:hypothetical protein
MDWPLIGAFAGVTALAGAVGTGGYLMLNSVPTTAKAPPPPILLVERSRVSVDAGRVYLATASAVPNYTVPTLRLAPAPRYLVILPPDDELPPIDEQAPAHARRPADDRTSTLPHPAKHKASPSLKPVEHVPHSVDRRYAHVLTSQKISELRSMLHLLSDQRLLWPPVAAALREIGRAQIAQIKRGEHPEVDSKLMMRLYWAAQPLLASLHPQQKEKVRALARSLGYANVASML